MEYKKKALMFLGNQIEFLIILFVILIIFIFNSNKEIYNCSKLPSSYKSYEEARQLFSETSFKLIDEADVFNSSLITAEYYSCDNKIGFLIIETSKEYFIFQNVPRKIWDNFKKAESKDIFYYSQIKGHYALSIK